MVAHVHGVEPAVDGQARQLRQWRWKRAASRRRVERATNRVREHDPMQAAPAIVVLVGRTLEGRLERRAGQQRERAAQAPQHDGVTPIGCRWHARHFEEIDPGPADAGAFAEGVEEIYRRAEAARKFRLYEERIGDLFLLGEKDVAFGALDRVREDIAIRSHGSRHESAVPVLRYGVKGSEKHAYNVDLTRKFAWVV